MYIQYVDSRSNNIDKHILLKQYDIVQIYLVFGVSLHYKHTIKTINEQHILIIMCIHIMYKVCINNNTQHTSYIHQ